MKLCSCLQERTIVYGAQAASDSTESVLHRIRVSFPQRIKGESCCVQALRGNTKASKMHGRKNERRGDLLRRARVYLVILSQTFGGDLLINQLSGRNSVL